MTEKANRTFGEWKSVLLFILGIILGVRLYDLYEQGGLSSLAAEGSISLLVVAILAVVIWYGDRIVRSLRKG